MRESERKRRIIEYLKKNLKKGYTEESLKWALIGQGYSRILVEQAVNQMHLELAEKAPIINERPIIRHEIIDEKDRPIEIRKPWWKKFF